jgi:hypothetical protein
MNKRDLRSKSVWRESQLWQGAWILLLAWVGIAMILKFDVFEHSPRDSFTLMAQAWRKGLLHLEKDYPWLELAIYEGNYYVSFPSVPALVMLPLTFIFGDNTPNTIVTGCYLMGGYMAGYHLCRRFRKPADAQFFALFLTMGCNMMYLSLTGDVWNQGQLLCFFLTTMCALGITGKTRAQWGWGLFCLALSVGCRPFQAVYVPFALWMLYQNLQRERETGFWTTILRGIPFVIAPALVAVLLGWYNWARFGNPIEFGHNYLPEFTRDPDKPQLGLQYIWNNLTGLLRLPLFNEKRLEFPLFNGFAFWMANPIFVTAGICVVTKWWNRSWDVGDTLLCIGFGLEIFLLLIHKTFGGWQFGARYLCDLIPMMMLFQLRGRKRRMHWETAIGSFAIAFNLYGAIVFYLIDQGK